MLLANIHRHIRVHVHMYINNTHIRENLNFLLKYINTHIYARTCVHTRTYIINFIDPELKVKGRFLELFNTAAIFGLLYYYSQQVPAFISRGATHHTDARDLYQRRWEILPMNFASKFVIYGNLLGFFTCSKAGTWDRFFYFPSEGRHTDDFPDSRKIQRLRPGLNPRTRVPVASMLTTRPPKPSFDPEVVKVTTRCKISHKIQNWYHAKMLQGFYRIIVCINLLRAY